MLEKLLLTIVHTVPGRVRLVLSRHPRDIGRMREEVKGHEGISDLDYTEITRSLVIRFEPAHIGHEEIVLRVALSLSRDYELAPVHILAKPDPQDLTEWSWYSGMLLIAAFVSRLGNWTSPVLDRFAAFGTAAAVVQHAWQDFHREGNLHPEALSLVYMITSVNKSNFMSATALTWITTFGRHLVNLPATGVQMRAVKIPGNDEHDSRYQITISLDESSRTDKMLLFRLLPSVIMDAVGWDRSERLSMLDKIRELSKNHGKVLEGLGDLRDGITLRIR